MTSTGFDWVDKKVLVTGATGMLGSSLIPRLCRRNAIVYGWSRRGDSIPDAHESLACDLSDYASVVRQVGRTTFDVIVHLAAQSQDTDVGPRSTFEANVCGTLNVLEAIRSAGSETAVIIASSRAVTVRSSELRIRSDPYLGIRPYEASKMCAELVARCYRDSYGLKLGIVRLPNLFGPRDRNTRRLVPGTICAALGGRPPVVRSDPSTLINFLYVDEAAEAILRLAEQIVSSRSSGSTVSIQSRESLTIGEMLNAILARMQRPDLLPDMAARPSEKARPPGPMPDVEEWDWQPRISLHEGLDRTIDWYRHHYTA